MSIFHQIIPDVQTAALSIRRLMIVHNGYAFGKNTQMPVSKRVLLAIKLHPNRCHCEKPRSFNDFRVFLRPIFEVGKKDIKKGFGKISGLEPLRTRFWAAFPEFFRESGSFLLSAKCRISTGVFVGIVG